MASNGKTAAPPEAEVVAIDPNAMRMSPQAMRMLTVATGRTMEQLMASDESADKFQAMAFIELRKRHPELSPADLWTLAGEAEVEIRSEESADPFGTASTTAAPCSPATGASTPTPSTT